MKKPLLIFLGLFLITLHLHATHNYGGEISYRQLSEYMIECTISTYTKSSSADADRDSLTLSWGDGQAERVVRVNGPDTDGDGVPNGVILGNDYQLNIYIAVHTYQSFGSYIISMEDPNRNAGILNVNAPNSVSVPFAIQTDMELSADFNSSPILLNPPVDFAVTGEVFLHTPNAFDIDDDSIAYELVTPLQGVNEAVPNYIPINGASLNPETGLLSWVPTQAGEYTIAIAVKSYRDGQLIDRTIRDMNILVEDGSGLTPQISTTTNYSQTISNPVMVGETVSIEVTAADMNNTQVVSLASNSGLYEFFDTPATFAITEENSSTGAATFTWVPTTEHVRNYPIQLVIKVNNTLWAADYLVFRFNVENVTSSDELVRKESTISVYPNPVETTLYLRSSENLSGSYRIHDTKGSMLQNGQLDHSNEITIGSLPSGKYFLQLQSGQTIPFIKQ